MKERPIIFSAPMVRAILAGTKTQTRRVVKPIGWDPSGPEYSGDGIVHLHANAPHIGLQAYFRHTGTGSLHGVRCPHGQPGDKEWQNGPIPGNGYYKIRGLLAESLGGDDRAVFVNADYFTWGFSESDDPDAIWLDTDINSENIQWKRAGTLLWVRETWQKAGGDSGYWWYRSTDSEADDGGSPVSQWRSSIHMPRHASRITLEITDVRVERLQDISEADLRAEGGLLTNQSTLRLWYSELWESINGPGSWDANPWVWVVEFKRITP